MNIGNWAKRPRGKWHLIESVIAGDAVTKCGRRLRDEVELQVSDVMPLTRMIGQPQLCKAGCDRPGMVVFNNEEPPVTPADHGAFPEPEDDASTANEVADA